MTWLQREIQLPRSAPGVHGITDKVLDAMPEIADIRTGLLHLFLRHTSASLSITENADPDVLKDLDRVFDKLAPEDFPYRHSDEGSDDMPSHAKCAMIGCSLSVPISEGRLCLGTWQGICLCEHRRGTGRRRLVLTIRGEAR